MSPSFRRDGKFAKALAAAMKRAKMGHSDVARSLKVQRRTVQSWLTGSEPLDDNFRKLVALFPELSRFEA